MIVPVGWRFSSEAHRCLISRNNHQRRHIHKAPCQKPVKELNGHIVVTNEAL